LLVAETVKAYPVSVPLVTTFVGVVVIDTEGAVFTVPVALTVDAAILPT